MSDLSEPVPGSLDQTIGNKKKTLVVTRSAGGQVPKRGGTAPESNSAGPHPFRPAITRTEPGPRAAVSAAHGGADTGCGWGLIWMIVAQVAQGTKFICKKILGMSITFCDESGDDN